MCSRTLDPFYLAWKAREYDFPTRFIELAGEINLKMPYFVADKLQAALNAVKKPLNGSRVLVLGVAYKKDINDPRESPALKVIELLEDRGAEVMYHDPHIPVLRPQASYGRTARSVELDAGRLANLDAFVITTDHASVDYELVAEHASLILDTRNIMARRGISGPARIVKL